VERARLLHGSLQAEECAPVSFTIRARCALTQRARFTSSALLGSGPAIGLSVHRSRRIRTSVNPATSRPFTRERVNARMVKRSSCRSSRARLPLSIRGEVRATSGTPCTTTHVRTGWETDRVSYLPPPSPSRTPFPHGGVTSVTYFALRGLPVHGGAERYS